MHITPYSSCIYTYFLSLGTSEYALPYMLVVYIGEAKGLRILYGFIQCAIVVYGNLEIVTLLLWEPRLKIIGSVQFSLIT
jgi:hypothetical protein